MTVALVGKYVDLPDAYLSVTEALRAGGFAHRTRVEIRWVPSDDCATPAGAAAALSGVDGVLIPGGFGVRGIEGKVGAIRYARERGIPALGLCLGLQCMVIETARHLAGLEDANSTEFDPATPHPVISTMADQVDVVAGERDMGGTMRLGAYPEKLVPGSIVAEAYGRIEVSARHRHRYEVNNDYRTRLQDAGLVVSGTSPDGRLVEYVELSRELHPFFVGTQAHPEFTSRPTRPQPLFRAFVAAAVDYEAAERLPVEIGECGRPAGVRPQWTVGGRRLRVTDFDTVSVHAPSTPDSVLTLRADEVRMPGGEVKVREVVEQPGAVGIVALDEQDQVVLIRQYRHPVGDWLVELPAGLLDEPGEKAYAAAARELTEEVALTAAALGRAGRPAQLAGPVDRGGADLPGPRPRAGARGRPATSAIDEEADLGVHRRPLDEAVAAVFTGEIENALRSRAARGRVLARARLVDAAPGRTRPPGHCRPPAPSRPLAGWRGRRQRGHGNPAGCRGRPRQPQASGVAAPILMRRRGPLTRDASARPTLRRSWRVAATAPCGPLRGGTGS